MACSIYFVLNSVFTPATVVCWFYCINAEQLNVFAAGVLIAGADVGSISAGQLQFIVMAQQELQEAKEVLEELDIA